MTEETNTQYIFDRISDGFWRVISGLKKVAIVVLVLGSIYALIRYWNDLPNWGQLAVLVVPIVVGVSFAVSRPKIEEELTSDKVPLLTLDATEPDLNLACWGISRAKRGELDTENQLESVQTLQGDARIARRFWPDEMRAEGTWRASKTDRELLLAEESIAEIRDELEPDSKELVMLQARVRSIVRHAVKDIVMDILRVIELETVFSGEVIGNVIDRALGQVDVDEYYSRSEEPAETGEQIHAENSAVDSGNAVNKSDSNE